MRKTKSKKLKLKSERNKLANYQKVQNLGKSWNPLPERNQKNTRVNSSIDKNSNFINCNQHYFNVGKYKGMKLSSAPVWYMNWVVNNVRLNKSELNLISKYIKQKETLN